MPEATTKPTDNDLEVASNVLGWLIAYLLEHNPEATNSLAVLRLAIVEIPGSIAELEGLS